MVLEQWELYLKDAEENSKAAKELFDKGSLGLAAYHAQQTVELTVKAYGLNFGFIESPDVSNQSKTHLPSKILLSETFERIIESFNKLSLRTTDTITKDQLIKGISHLENTKDLLKKLDSRKNGELKEAVWRYSLNQDTDNERVKKYQDSIEEITTTTYPNELTKVQLNNFNTTFQDTFNDLRKTRKSHLIEMIKNIALKKTRVHKIPNELVEIFFVTKISEESFKKIFKEKSNIASIDVLQLLYGKNGMLQIIQELPIEMKNESDFNENVKLAKLTLLNVLTDLSLLTYPHEDYGRYSTKISDTESTRDVYQNQKKELEVLINRCITAYEKFDYFLKNDLI